MPTPDPLPWWRSGVVYQVYPRSFADSTGDGVGDLEGVRRRLDHLAGLGIDAVWLSPFYRSPMADFGYDVADFCDVDPLFGDLAALRPAAGGCPRTEGSGWWSTWSPTTPRPSTRGSRSPGPGVGRRSATGTCGTTGEGPNGPPTTGRTPSAAAARPGRGTSATEQWYLHQFLPRAARPQLGQPCRGRGHARGHAVLARPWRRRVPDRRRALHRSRPGVPGRPSSVGRAPALRLQRARQHPRAHPWDAAPGRRATPATGS